MSPIKTSICVFLLTLVALTNATLNNNGYQQRANERQPGGITDVTDTNSLKVTKVIQLAKKHLETHLDGCTTNLSVQRVQSQVISGTMYFVHIRVGPCGLHRTQSGSNASRICKVSVWDQPWVGQPRVHEYTCQRPTPIY